MIILFVLVLLAVPGISVAVYHATLNYLRPHETVLWTLLTVILMCGVFWLFYWLSPDSFPHNIQLMMLPVTGTMLFILAIYGLVAALVALTD